MSRNWLLRNAAAPRAVLCSTAIFFLLFPAFAFATPCVVPNNGGTVSMPPANCGYVSPTDFHMIVDGLTPPTTIQIGVEHQRFFNVTSGPGGSLGGEKENFGSDLHMVMTGTNGLVYSRDLHMQANCETHIAPRTPGDVVQSFDTDMFKLQGQLPAGDPDFDLLRITAGSSFGMPSPGHTTLTLRNDGQWNVDSFFDITYRIDFIGHSPGPLAGHSGSTTGTIRMGTGDPVPPPPPPCTVVDNGTGTVDLPPQGCGYVSPADLHMMIDGLPPGTSINVDTKHQDFFQVTHTPGGSLGGEIENFHSGLFLNMNGNGFSFHKTVNMQVQCQTHTAPRTPGDNIQSFDTIMNGIQGQLPPGDPDFDLLRITAGNAFGMPSPGHTALTKIPGSPGVPPQWAVDSFFDITYRIDFIGHSPGPLGGHSGSTTGTIRMQAGQPTLVSVPLDKLTTRGSISLRGRPNPFGLATGTTLEYRLPQTAFVNMTVYDATGKVVRSLLNERVPAGPHAMMWDGRDNIGRRMGSGTYFVKLAIDGRIVSSHKATVIR